MQCNQIESPLLRLPPELRNHIYRFFFDSATLKRDLKPSSANRCLVEVGNPCLFLVCRQIYCDTRPFQGAYSYKRLILRVNSKQIAGLVDWVGQEQCAQIVRIDMFQSLAGAIEQTVRAATLQGPYAGPWPMSGDLAFPGLNRVVVTYPIDRADNAIEIGEALQTLFGNPEIDVQFKRARYWR